MTTSSVVCAMSTLRVDVGSRSRRVRPPESVILRPRCGVDDLAAVGDRGVGGGELQRRRFEVALADGEVDRVARLPELVDLGLEVGPVLLPLRRRDAPGDLEGDVDPGGLAHAEALGPILQRPRPARLEHVADVVEVHVARLRDGADEGEVPVAVQRPALELLGDRRGRSARCSSRGTRRWSPA